jgi:hypothetical protein
MAKLDRLTNERVDAFVAAVNSSAREILFLEEIPEQCRRLEHEVGGMFDWRIVPAPDAGWLSELEGDLPFRLPSTLRSLVERYLFPSFEAGPLTFFSVGNETDRLHEFRWAILGDRYMSPFLLKNGFVQFARPSGGHYDPVCFDFRASHRRREPSVVRIDHEEILCNERLHIVETVAPGLDVLLEEVTRQLRSAASEKRST